jgi:hypothetical protein
MHCQSVIYERRVIHAELKMLGIPISERSVFRVLRRLRGPPAQTWKTFLHNHFGHDVGLRIASLGSKKSSPRPRVLATHSPNGGADRFGMSASVKLILFGESSLTRSLTQFTEPTERNHQGKRNVLLFADAGEFRPTCMQSIQCRERLGGLLKYYYPKVA